MAHFAGPPSELAVHPAGGQPHHEVYLMCDDIHTTVAELAAKGAEFADGVIEQRWGLSTTLKLPGGGQISLYQPKPPQSSDHLIASRRRHAVSRRAARSAFVAHDG
jgi:hypothetical protein